MKWYWNYSIIIAAAVAVIVTVIAVAAVHAWKAEEYVLFVCNKRMTNLKNLSSQERTFGNGKLYRKRNDVLFIVIASCTSFPFCHSLACRKKTIFFRCENFLFIQFIQHKRRNLFKSRRKEEEKERKRLAIFFNCIFFNYCECECWRRNVQKLIPED